MASDAINSGSIPDERTRNLPSACIVGGKIVKKRGDVLINIIDTTDNVLSLFTTKTFNIELWTKYATSISLELVSKCQDDCKEYDFDKDVLPIIINALSDKERISNLSNTFRHIVKQLNENISFLFNNDDEVDIYLYLGLCNGAGWVTTLESKNVILLGIEKILELSWDDCDNLRGLIFHELGHVWHKTYGNLYFTAHTQKEKSLLQLYQEGIAMVCEQVFSNYQNYYHQDKNGWLNWCLQNENSIKTEYSRRLIGNKSTQDFFGDWCNYQGYSDVGYFLGCKFIRFVMKEKTISEIANMKFDNLYKYFNMYVNL